MVYYFPENITSKQQGHWMKIDVFNAITLANKASSYLPGGAVRQTAERVVGSSVTTAIDSFLFFVPGGPTNGQSLVWSHQHEYTDVKLARLFMTPLGVAADPLAGAATLMGTPINPRVDVLFRNTNLREYQFNLLLAPQSKTESLAMKEMLKMFRYYAAPDFEDATGLNLTYITPNQFEIQFRYMDVNGVPRLNDNMPKIARGVIKRIDIDYTPQGEFSTFYDGTPVSAMLTFTFLETMLIGKKQIINDGY